MSNISELLPYRIPNVKNRRLLDPHVVIVGAGASIAACSVDKNGMQVPLLKNIHNILVHRPLNNYTIKQLDFHLLKFHPFYTSNDKQLAPY